MKSHFFILLLFLSHIAVGQEKIVLFPQNVNIDDYTNCKCADTVELKKSIAQLEFAGEKRYRYPDDYSNFKFVDLNSDGNCEVLHYFSSSVIGWTFDFMTIYVVGDTVKEVGMFTSFLMRFAESNEGFLQINEAVMEGHKTNPIYYNSVWRFDGKRYSEFYSSKLTRGEFQQKGVEAYKNERYQEAFVCFSNALVVAQYSYSNQKMLECANDVAITLIKLNRQEEVQPLLSKYLEQHSDNNTKVAAYFNIGLAMEKMNNSKEALRNFELSCKYRDASACRDKLKEIKSKPFQTTFKPS